MDSKETLIRKLPIIGIIFVLILSAAFYLCRPHDEQIWQSLYDFHEKNLLFKEKLIYQDFYHKRLAIEQKGSKTQLALIEKALSEKDNQTLSHLILLDRNFREYLVQKIPIYFSPSKNEQWQTDNQTLMMLLQQLSVYQFAIIPEQFISFPSTLNLLTYIFIDSRPSNVVSNIFLFLLLCFALEQLVKRSLFLSFILAASFMYSCLYVFIADSLSPPLQSFNSIVYFLSFAVFSIFIRSKRRKQCTTSKLHISLGLALFCLKISHDIYLDIFSIDQLICLSFMCAATAVIAWIYDPLLAQEPLMLHSNIDKSETLSQSVRHQYAESLKGLSRFNFAYARKLLRTLKETQPESLQILESSYHLEKLKPDESFFWELAEARIKHCLVSDNYKDMLDTFQDIQKAAPSKHLASQHISSDSYLKMLVVFIRHRDIQKAEHAFMFLELAGDRTLVKEACNLLIDSFSKMKNQQKKKHYQALFDRYLEAM